MNTFQVRCSIVSPWPSRLSLWPPCSGSQPAPREQVGPLPGGGFLLNSGWRVEPAGKQIPLDTLPMSSRALAGRQVPAGAQRRIQAALHQRDRDRHRRGSRGSVPVADGWLGLAFSPKGDRVYVGGGSQAAVFEFAFANGALTPGAHLRRGAAGTARRRAISSATSPSRPTAA